jgi:MFS family permease
MQPALVDSRTAWAIAVAQLLLVMMANGAVYILWVGLKPIAVDFDWPRWVPSFAYSINMIGTGLGGIVMGRWLDRSGIGGPVLLGSLALVLGLLLSSRLESAWELYLYNGLLIGFLGNGAMFAPLLTNTTRWFERHRGLAVAVVASGQGLAGAVWPPVFRWVIDGAGWRQLYLWYGVASLVFMLPLAFAVRRRAPGVSAAALLSRLPGGKGIRGLPGELPHWILCLGIFTCCVAMAVPLVHVVAHASDLGLGADLGATLLAVILALSFASRLGIGLVADRLGSRNALLVASALQGAGLAIFLVAEGTAGLFVAAVVFGSGFGGLIPSYAVVARELYPPEDTGWRIGAIFFAGSLGMAGGGWMAGYIFDHTGDYGLAFAASVAFNVVNLALLAFLRFAGGPEAKAAA